MYKCKECGAKYEQKPDYCECGNDTFVKLVPKSDPAKVTSEQDIDIDSGLEDFRTYDDYESNNKQHNEFNELSTQNNNVFSFLIFVFCIILAFVILFFIGNPKNETKKDTQKEETAQQTREIPALDSFWDNTLVKVESPKQQQPQQDTNTIEIPIVSEIPRIVQQIIPAQPKPQEQKPVVKNTVSKPVQKPSTNVVQSKPKTQVKQTTQTVTKQTTLPKPVQTTTSSKQNNSVNDLMNRIKNNQASLQTSNHSQTTTKQQSQTTVSTQQPSAPIPKTQTQQQQNTQTQAQLIAQQQAQAAQAAKQAAQAAAAAKQELANYKTSLRNAIGRKIDFASVVGDGTCSLSFRINSSGRLTNRTFTKQSSNLTLNEAVYSAMNATPSYNPPPEAYKNETLNLTIRFYNGNFEISLN